MGIAGTVGRGVAWNTIGTVFGKIIIFANIFLILTHLSVYEYGLSELVLSVVAIIGMFQLPGLTSAVIADLGAERGRGEFGRMKSLFLQFFSFNAALGVVAWGVLFFGAPMAAHLSGNISIEYFLRIVSFTFLISPLRTATTTLAAVELRFMDQSLYSVVEEIAKFLFLLLMFFGLGKTIDGLLFAIVLAQCATVLLFLPRTLSAYQVFAHSDASDRGAFWHMLREHRKWSVANSYISTLGQNMQLWIIRFLLGTEAVGLYAFVQGVYSHAASLMPFGTVLGPLAPRYADKTAQLVPLVRSSIKAQFLLALGLTAAAYVALPILMFIFPKYQASSTLYLVFLLTLLPGAIAAIYTPAFNALKLQYAYFQSALFKFILIAVLVPTCIFLFGFVGIGIAAVVVMSLSVVERTWRLRRHLPDFSVDVRHFFSFNAAERDFLRLITQKIRARQFGGLFADRT